MKWINQEPIIQSGEGNGTPLQYSCLENPMDGGAWKAAIHGVAKSRARQSDFTFTFHFHALEKEMTSHSSILAWRIPGTEETSGLLSLGSHRVGHDWSDLAAAASLFQLHLFLDCSLLLSAGLQVILDLSLSSWTLSFASYFLIYHPKYFSIYSLLFHHKLIFQR